MSAKILSFNDYYVERDGLDEIDLVTAVDVAIRDLHEILQCWGTEAARERAQECESTLRRALQNFSMGQSEFAD